jgi:oligoribonuclease
VNKFNAPLVFLDCEMTGPDPVEHQLVEIAAIHCDPKNFGILSSFHTYVGATEEMDSNDVITRAHPKVLKKVEISKDRLDIAPPPGEAVQKLREWLPKGQYIWVGHNLMLDFMFLRRAREPEIRFNYRFLDLTALVELYAYQKNIELEGYSLGKVAETLGIEVKTQLHCANNDVILVLDIFKYLMSGLTF